MTLTAFQREGLRTSRIHEISHIRSTSLNIIVQIERRLGIRFVSEFLAIQGFDPEADR
jgi:hypothetical protein